MSETHNRFELGIFMYGTCNSMNNLSSYCGLVDAKISASDKDLPVKTILQIKMNYAMLFNSQWRNWNVKLET